MLRKEDISIIVVDDLQFSCEVVKSGLKKSGYKDIRTANSANQAMLLMNQQRADVVLADFWMPEMNGLEAIYHIRADEETKSLPIIALTALAMPGDRKKCLAAGADSYICKPLNLKELSKIIEHLLEESHGPE